MARTLIVLAAALAVGAALLLWLLHDAAPSRVAAPDAAAGLPAVATPPEGLGPPGSTVDAARAARPRSPPVPSREREQAIRLRLVEALRASPEVRTADIRCSDDEHCRVELEAPDLERAGPVLERLASPEGGFAGEARQMRMEAPVALGQDAGPWRVAFTLEY